MYRYFIVYTEAEGGALKVLNCAHRQEALSLFEKVLKTGYLELAKGGNIRVKYASLTGVEKEYRSR